MKRALALILAGLALLTYPILAQYFARKNQMQAARAYASGVEEMTRQRLDALWAEAEEKRDDPAAYEELLDPEGSGIMATLEIPKINLTIPVCHCVGGPAICRKRICPWAAGAENALSPVIGACPERNCLPGWTSWSRGTGSPCGSWAGR